MKRLVCLCVVVMLFLCGCGGDTHSVMSKENKKELERYLDWYQAIYSEGDNVELYNFVSSENEILLVFTGKNQDIISFFAKAIEESNEFVDENPKYFEAETVIKMEYYTAGARGITISTDGEDLHFSNMLFQADLCSLSGNAVNYSLPFVEINEAQDMITYDKDSNTYDLTALDSFSNVQKLDLSFRKMQGQAFYDYDEVERLVEEKMPNSEIEIEIFQSR